MPHCSSATDHVVTKRQFGLVCIEYVGMLLTPMAWFFCLNENSTPDICCLGSSKPFWKKEIIAVIGKPSSKENEGCAVDRIYADVKSGSCGFQKVTDKYRQKCQI